MLLLSSLVMSTGVKAASCCLVISGGLINSFSNSGTMLFVSTAL